MNQWPPYEHYGPLAPAPGSFAPAPAGYGPAPSAPARPPSRGTAYTAAVLAILLSLPQLLAVSMHARHFMATRNTTDPLTGPYAAGLAISLLTFAGLTTGAVLVLQRRFAGSFVLTLTISGAIVAKTALIGYLHVNHDEASWFQGVRALMWLCGIDLTGVIVVGVLISTLVLLPATRRWCGAQSQPAWDSPPFSDPGYPGYSAPQQPYYGP